MNSNGQDNTTDTPDLIPTHGFAPPLAIELGGEDEDEDDDTAEIRTMVEEAVIAVLEPLHDKILRLQQQLGATAGAAPALSDVHELREIQERDIAAVDVALVDVGERLDRIEEHIGLKPSLLSAVERVVGELDGAAQSGSLNPRAIGRLHRQLRAALLEERAKKVNGA